MIYAIAALLCIAVIQGTVVCLLWHKVNESEKSRQMLMKAFAEDLTSTRVTAEQSTSMIQELAKKVDDLERGIVPDYEKAKEAASWLDKFNESVTGYLSYDPIAAIRDRKGSGG